MDTQKYLGTIFLMCISMSLWAPEIPTTIHEWYEWGIQKKIIDPYAGSSDFFRQLSIMHNATAIQHFSTILRQALIEKVPVSTELLKKFIPMNSNFLSSLVRDPTFPFAQVMQENGSTLNELYQLTKARDPHLAEHLATMLLARADAPASLPALKELEGDDFDALKVLTPDQLIKNPLLTRFIDDQRDYFAKNPATANILEAFCRAGTQVQWQLFSPVKKVGWAVEALTQNKPDLLLSMLNAHDSTFAEEVLSSYGMSQSTPPTQLPTPCVDMLIAANLNFRDSNNRIDVTNPLIDTVRTWLATPELLLSGRLQKTFAPLDHGILQLLFFSLSDFNRLRGLTSWQGFVLYVGLDHIIKIPLRLAHDAPLTPELATHLILLVAHVLAVQLKPTYHHLLGPYYSYLLDHVTPELLRDTILPVSSAQQTQRYLFDYLYQHSSSLQPLDKQLAIVTTLYQHLATLVSNEKNAELLQELYRLYAPDIAKLLSTTEQLPDFDKLLSLPGLTSIKKGLLNTIRATLLPQKIADGDKAFVEWWTTQYSLYGPEKTRNSLIQEIQLEFAARQLQQRRLAQRNPLVQAFLRLIDSLTTWYKKPQGRLLYQLTSLVGHLEKRSAAGDTTIDQDELADLRTKLSLLQIAQKK